MGYVARDDNAGIKYTLITLMIMVFGMLVIGGLTRLTGSGLSIVEWKPITGILPPLSHDDWINLFNLYKSSPEFLKVNSHMGIEEFKGIFWLEYIHRLWGRAMGVILLVISYQTISNQLFRKIGLSVGILWILGAGQGVMGWYMVKSGLVNDPHVSPFRLAAHMAMAFMIIANIIWIYVKISPCESPTGYSRTAFQRVKSIGLILTGMVFITAIVGAMVAGHKAGLIYNTFPLMDGKLIPSEAWFYDPWWANLYDNPATIQWLHRVVATITATSAIWFGICAVKWQLPNNLIFSSMLLTITASTQYALGIATVILEVPISLGVIHQATAFILFSIATYMSFSANKYMSKYV